MVSTVIDTLQVNVGRRMEGRTVDRILKVLEASPTVRTVDVMGWAPELNPHFRRLVDGALRFGTGVIDRCNLKVLFEPGQESTAEFLASRGVRVLAPLPPPGAREQGMRALSLLTSLGYGGEDTGLELDLVHAGDVPVDGLGFGRLLALSSVPVRRILGDLETGGKLEEYMTLLVNSLDPREIPGIVCRKVVSVGWDGRMHDPADGWRSLA